MAEEPFDPAAFLRTLAPHVLAELRPPAGLKEFTTNPALIGGYVEAAVRELIRRYVFPLRVCTGAVIDQSGTRGSQQLPQADSIIWSPSPVPAVFHVGDFALVPRSSALGIVEVKSSAYRIEELETALDQERQAGGPLPILGVICVLQTGQPKTKARELRESNRIVVLFEETNGEYIPQPADVFRFINFLASLRFEATKREGQIGINLDLLKEPQPGPA